MLVAAPVVVIHWSGHTMVNGTAVVERVVAVQRTAVTVTVPVIVVVAVVVTAVRITVAIAAVTITTATEASFDRVHFDFCSIFTG